MNFTRKDTSIDLPILVSVCGMASVMVGVVLLLLHCRRCLPVWKRWRRVRRRSSYMLVNDDGSSYYGSLSQSTQLDRSSLSISMGKPPVFILYGLELQSFQSVSHTDSPTYALLLELVFFLHMMGVGCYHDAFQSFSSAGPLAFSSRVEQALREAKAVVVLCSEVLHTALTAPQQVKHVQMQYGQFITENILQLLADSPEKIVPVFLAGTAPLCPELSKGRSFALQQFQGFMRGVRVDGECTGDRVGLRMQKQGFTELQDFVNHVKTLSDLNSSM